MTDVSGFKAVATGCKILRNDSFQGNDGKMVYICTFAGFGFTNKAVEKDGSLAEAWPPAGTECDVHCDLISGKDGSFTLGPPTFVVRQPAISKKAG